VGPLKQDGRVVTDDTEMAEVLNEFFSSVFTREDTSNIPDPKPMRKNTKLKNIWITTKEVKKRIDKLKTQSSPELDGITPRLLKETKDEIAPLLARIFRESLRTGVVPRDWKEAKVVPIFKKDLKLLQGTTDRSLSQASAAGSWKECSETRYLNTCIRTTCFTPASMAS
jgi:hypothetical protein